MEPRSCALPKGDLFAEYLGKAPWVYFKHAREGALLKDSMDHRCALAGETSTGLDVSPKVLSRWFAW